MTPDRITMVIFACISLAGTAINVYVGLYVRAALLALKADILTTVRAETYSREVVDLKLEQVLSKAMAAVTHG